MPPGTTPHLSCVGTLERVAEKEQQYKNQDRVAEGVAEECSEIH